MNSVTYRLTSLTLAPGFSSLKVLRKSFLQKQKAISASTLRVHNYQLNQVWDNEHYIKIKKAVRGRLVLFEVEEFFFSSLPFLSLFGLGSSDVDFFLK